MQRFFHELAKHERLPPERQPAHYVRLKQEIKAGNFKALEDQLFDEHGRLEAVGRTPVATHHRYGAALSWLLHAFPLGKYEPAKVEFKGEREVYHPVFRVVAKHEVIAKCAKGAAEREALRAAFDRLLRSADVKEVRARRDEQDLLLARFVKSVGLENASKIFERHEEAKPMSSTFLDALGDKKLLSKAAHKTGRRQGLKPGRSFVRHLYAQEMSTANGFVSLLGMLFNSRHGERRPS